jgi:hypothetical protein
MATLRQVQAMMRAQPFKPFQVQVTSGRSFTVKHPDYISYSEDGEEVTIHDRDGVHLLDVLLIEVLEPVRAQGEAKPEGNGA